MKNFLIFFANFHAELLLVEYIRCHDRAGWTSSVLRVSIKSSMLWFKSYYDKKKKLFGSVIHKYWHQ